MAIITAGYDGTVDETQFANLLHRYSVVNPDDFYATTIAGDRIVSLSDGTAMGPGTIDVATNLSPIQFAPATTGTTRWDLVALRRDWQPPGGLSQIVIIQGGNTTALPLVGTDVASWNRRPGIVDDQPLYLQQVNGTLLGVRLDLRVWAGTGGAEARDGAVLQYLARPGAEVKIGTNVWRYSHQANGVWQWVAQAVEHSAPAGPSVYGNGFVPYTAQGWSGVSAQLVEGVVYINGAAKCNLNWSAGAAICNFAAPYRPAANIQGVNCQVTPGGDIVVTASGLANQAVSVAAAFPISLSEV